MGSSGDGRECGGVPLPFFYAPPHPRHPDLGLQAISGAILEAFHTNEFEFGGVPTGPEA